MQESDYFIKAREYLLSFEEVTEEMLNAQLNEWRERKPTDIKGLFKAFLLHAQNRQGMPNSIGDISKLSDLLFKFNPKKVVKNYGSWEEIFDAIASGTYKPPGRMEKKITRITGSYTAKQ